MREIEHKKGKIYYSMGEVAEMFDVRPSLLRYWEQEFDILKPHRNKKGNRLFTPQDVDNINVIYHLLKEKKMKIEVARKHLKDNKNEADRDAEIVERLMSIRSTLQQIKQDMLHGEAIDDDDYDAPAPVVREKAKSTRKAEDKIPGADGAEAQLHGGAISADGVNDFPVLNDGNITDGVGESAAEPMREATAAGGAGRANPVGSTVVEAAAGSAGIASGIFGEGVITVSAIAGEEADNAVPPPFEQQMLFEVVPEQEAEKTLDEMIDSFLSKNYDPEADEQKEEYDPFAALSDKNDAPNVAGQNKPRMTVIEQTLF